MDTVQLISVKQAARMLGMKPNTLYKWGREGKLKRFYVGRNLRFLRSDVEALIKEGENRDAL